jgi:hypothetical protein
MSRWQHLHDRARELELERQRQKDMELARQAARAEMDAWAAESLARVWPEIEATLRRRADALGRASSISISITERHHTRWAAGNQTRMLAIETEATTVYLYSHQVSGFSPTFHLVEWPTSPSSRRQRHRLMTLSLCRLERTGPKQFQLVRADPAGASLDYDDIAYRVLELLVVGMRRAAPKRLTLGEAPTAPELRPPSH